MSKINDICSANTCVSSFPDSWLIVKLTPPKIFIFRETLWLSRNYIQIWFESDFSVCFVREDMSPRLLMSWSEFQNLLRFVISVKTTNHLHSHIVIYKNCSCRCHHGHQECKWNHFINNFQNGKYQFIESFHFGCVCLCMCARLCICQVSWSLWSVTGWFLDALASLDLKLSVSEWGMFFGFPVNQVKQVMQVLQLIQVMQVNQW